MRIYIAGALSSNEKRDRTPSQIVVEYIQNINKMCLVASTLRKIGHYPYIPGLDFLLGVVVGSFEENDYRETGMAFLEVCDAVLVISNSWGVQQEVKRAQELGIPIYYDIEDIP